MVLGVTAENSVPSSPTTLLWAVRLLYLEFAGLVGLTGYLIYLDVRSSKLQVGLAASLTVMAAIGAVSVFFVARGLGRRAIRARGPAIVVQLFVIAAGGFLIQTSPVWLGVTLLGLGVLAGLLMVLPPSTRALGAA